MGHYTCTSTTYICMHMYTHNYHVTGRKQQLEGTRPTYQPRKHENCQQIEQKPDCFFRGTAYCKGTNHGRTRSEDSCHVPDYTSNPPSSATTSPAPSRSQTHMTGVQHSQPDVHDVAKRAGSRCTHPRSRRQCQPSHDDGANASSQLDHFSILNVQGLKPWTVPSKVPTGNTGMSTCAWSAAF